MTRTICMEVDDEVLLGMNKSPEELAGEMRLAAAVKWYEVGLIRKTSHWNLHFFLLSLDCSLSRCFQDNCIAPFLRSRTSSCNCVRIPIWSCCTASSSLHCSCLSMSNF